MDTDPSSPPANTDTSATTTTDATTTDATYRICIVSATALSEEVSTDLCAALCRAYRGDDQKVCPTLDPHIRMQFIHVPFSQVVGVTDEVRRARTRMDCWVFVESWTTGSVVEGISGPKGQSVRLGIDAPQTAEEMDRLMQAVWQHLQPKANGVGLPRFPFPGDF